MISSKSLRLLTSAAAVSAACLVQPASVAQTSRTTVRRAAPATAHPAAEGGGCEKLPTMSPKIPALPAGSPCAKALYTISTTPGAKLDYISPLEGSSLPEKLGLETSTFSLDFIDTRIGTGALAEPNKFYSVHYTGYLLDGTKFDSSVDRGEPIVIQIGQHQVIPGWDTGFAGMRVGGKRRLLIPYQLAYGAQGKPPAIPQRAELIFDVEFIAQSDTRPEPKAPPVPPAARTTPGAPSAPAVPPVAPPQNNAPGSAPGTASTPK